MVSSHSMTRCILNMRFLKKKKKNEGNVGKGNIIFSMDKIKLQIVKYPWNYDINWANIQAAHKKWFTPVSGIPTHYQASWGKIFFCLYTQLLWLIELHFKYSHTIKVSFHFEINQVDVINFTIATLHRFLKRTHFYHRIWIR